MTNLSTRAARRRLAIGKKHMTKIAKGRALYYRRLHPGEPGSWSVKLRAVEAQTKSGYVFGLLGEADDHQDGQGLAYADAVAKAKAWVPEAPPRPDGPPTVALAVERYIRWYVAHHGKTAAAGARQSLAAHALPTLGDLLVEDLTVDRLRRWHESVASTAPRRRGKVAKRKEEPTDEQRRQRKVTANRNLTLLKSALNKFWEDEMVSSREAWQRVKPFRKVEQSRLRYLDAEEFVRFANGCEPDFRALSMAAFYSGCRYGELTRLVVGDYHAEAGEHGAIFIAKSKSGNSRHIFLGAEAAQFFIQLVAGRKSNEVMLLRTEPNPRKAARAWRKNEQVRPMLAAVELAGLEPIVFHGLRHTFASLYLMSGGSLIGLAKQLGHADTRMVEKTYGHLSSAWRAEEAAQHAPTLGVAPAAGATVARIAAKR